MTEWLTVAYVYTITAWQAGFYMIPSRGMLDYAMAWAETKAN